MDIQKKTPSYPQDKYFKAAGKPYDPWDSDRTLNDSEDHHKK